MNVNTVTILASVLTMSALVVAQESFPVPVSDAFAVRRWTTADGLPGNRVTAIEKTSDGYLRVTTSGGTVRFDGVRFSPVDADRIPVPSVEDVSGRSPSAGNRELCRFGEKGGIAWVGTDGEGLLRIRPRVVAPISVDRDSSGRVRFRDSSGRIWSPTAADGVVAVSPDGTRREFGASEGFMAGDVTSFAETPDGDIWVGSAGAGLWRINGTEAARFHYSDDVECDFIKALFCDSEGTLWVCARGDAVTAISDGVSKTVRTGRTDGNASVTFHEEPMGRMWLSGGNSIISYLTADFKDFSDGFEDELPVDEFLSSAAFAPPQAIVEAPRAIPMEFKRSEEVCFRYTADLPGVADAVLFSCRLPPHENDWSPESGERRRSYGKLAPGKYGFEVRAKLPGGEWGNAATVEFTVVPKFHETVPFTVTVAASLLAALLAVVRAVYLRRMRARLASIRHKNILAMERARIARDIHDDVGARLTRISMLISMTAGKDGEAREIADEVRDVVRALDEVVWAVEPRNDTLSSFIDYVYNYAETFVASAKLGIRAAIPPEAPDAGIPSVVRHAAFMCVKEALNNVVKHAGASFVFVSIRILDGHVELRIGDDGKGFAGPRQGGNGLMNMRTRMEGVGGSFEIGPRSGGGSEVSLVFGFENKGG